MGNNTNIFAHSFNAKLPICQSAICSRCSFDIAVINVKTALINKEKTIPTNIIVLFSIFLSIRDVKLTARKTVNRPNDNPTKGRVNMPSSGILNPVIITNPAPTEAPDDTPRVYDEAKGFFNTDCITVPLTAKAPPTINAKRVLGNLKFHSIDAEVLGIWLGSGVENNLFNNILSISNGGT